MSVFMHAVSGKVCVSGFCFKALISVSTGVSTGQEKHSCRDTLPDHAASVNLHLLGCLHSEAAVELVFSQHQQMTATRGRCLQQLWGWSWMSHYLNGWNKEVITALLGWRRCIITQTFIQRTRAANDLHLTYKWILCSSVNVNGLCWTQLVPSKGIMGCFHVLYVHVQ